MVPNRLDRDYVCVLPLLDIRYDLRRRIKMNAVELLLRIIGTIILGLACTIFAVGLMYLVAVALGGG